MGLPWVRLDTSMPDNPKILGLLSERDGHRAAFVWVCALAYCGKHGTDGFIPRAAAPFCHGRNQDFARLTACSALKEVPGGWIVPEWSEFQESNDATRARSEKAQKAASARWSKDEHAKAKRKSRNGIRAVGDE